MNKDLKINHIDIEFACSESVLRCKILWNSIYLRMKRFLLIFRIIIYCNR